MGGQVDRGTGQLNPRLVLGVRQAPEVAADTERWEQEGRS